eukprot:14420950-Alexandrium_andersonii.AAC.1
MEVLWQQCCSATSPLAQHQAQAGNPVREFTCVEGASNLVRPSEVLGVRCLISPAEQMSIKPRERPDGGR